MPLQIELRPRCGLCGKELKSLKQMKDSSGAFTIHCCSECGAVLGITKEK